MPQQRSDQAANGADSAAGQAEATGDAVASQASGRAIPDEEQDETITLSAVGDIMFHQTQLDSGYNEASGTYDFKPFFEEVKPIIESADLAVANFETTTGGTDEYAHMGYPRFNSPDESIDALRYAGFDVLSTANNHSLDTGRNGVVRTLEQIHRRELDTVGTYAGKPESRVLLKTVKGMKLAFLSYTESMNGLESSLAPAERDTMINVIDKEKIKQDIADAKALNADFVIAFMHWGVEYAREPSAAQRELATWMAEAGVDIILGSHPHVIQPLETIEAGDGRRTYVAYSMGNFISNQRTETLDNPYTEDGVIIRFVLRKDRKTGHAAIEKVEYVPTWVNRRQVTGHDGYEFTVVPARMNAGSDTRTDEEKSRMRRSYTDTTAQMGGESTDEQGIQALSQTR
ncbi:CapA family protein [Cohnella sp. GCM10027633]|uniref:CapA family protein n=1 Tax=unclassified Cohnella TaxID=2636738 RepID=UPI00362AD1FE